MNKHLVQNLADEILEFVPMYFKFINPIIHSDKELFLNENQIKLIMMLNINGTMNPTNLSIFMDMPKGSLTTIIDSLVEKNLITRENDSHDRRKKIIALTGKGRDFAKTKINNNRVEFYELFERFEEDSLKKITTGFRELTQNLKRIDKN